MKKFTFLAFLLSAYSLPTLAQDDPTPMAYKLKKTAAIIYAYRNKADGTPDLSVSNFWNYNY